MTRQRVGLVAAGATAVLGLSAWAFLTGPLSENETQQGDTVEGWPPSPRVVERGRAIYVSNCATCHGLNGEGEPNWKVQNPDLTYPAPPHDASGHTWHHPDEVLLEIIREGGDQYDSPTFRSRMRAWGDRLTEEEIKAVLAYLKTRWGPEERSFQAEVSGDPTE